MASITGFIWGGIKYGLAAGVGVEALNYVMEDVVPKDSKLAKAWEEHFGKHIDDANEHMLEDFDKTLDDHPDLKAEWEKAKQKLPSALKTLETGAKNVVDDSIRAAGLLQQFIETIMNWFEDLMHPEDAAERKQELRAKEQEEKKEKLDTERTDAMSAARKLDVHDPNKIDDVLKLDPAAHKFGFDDATDMNNAAAVLKVKSKGEEEYLKQQAALAAQTDDKIKNAPDPTVAFLNGQAAALKLDPNDVYLGHKVVENLGYREPAPQTAVSQKPAAPISRAAVGYARSPALTSGGNAAAPSVVVNPSQQTPVINGGPQEPAPQQTQPQPNAQSQAPAGSGPPKNVVFTLEDGQKVNLPLAEVKPLHEINHKKGIFEADVIYKGGAVNAKGNYQNMTLQHAVFVQKTGVTPDNHPIGKVFASEDKLNGKVLENTVEGTPPKEKGALAKVGNALKPHVEFVRVLPPMG